MSIPNLPSKIAIFIPSSAVGGAEHYIKNILYLIEDFGCEPILILPKNQQLIDFFSELAVEQLIADIAWKGGAEDLKVEQNYLNKLSLQYREASEVLNSIQPDCAFINLPWVDFGLGITLACHELQIPSINLVHLCPWKVDLNNLTKLLFQDLAVANSHFYTVSYDNKIQLALSTGINIDLIQVFYNSRDVESKYIGLTTREYKLHRIELLDELELPLNSFLSVSVGRFSHQKNFLDVFTACSALQSKLPNYYHLFLGEGELKDYYEQTALSLGISDKLKFLGYRSDVDRFLSLSDLFISSSLYEGLALSILEAAQYTCPIIATNSSSAQEIIPNSEYGLLYNPGQYHLLQKHIEFAYFNPEKMLDKARKLKALCQEKFSLQKFNNDLQNVLIDAVSNQNHSTDNPLAVSYDYITNSLKVEKSIDLINYQYYGLTLNEHNTEIELSVSSPEYYQQILQNSYDQYLHALYKLSKVFLGCKMMLCFGSFNANFFRRYYLKDQYLLLVLTPQNNHCCNLSFHHINHTYWGQDIEPDCLAKFTTFDSLQDSAELKTINLNYVKNNHYYTSKYLLDSYLQLSNGKKLNNLSINLKMVDQIFQPSEYLMIEEELIVKTITTNNTY